jgi:hypothetical protein
MPLKRSPAADMFKASKRPFQTSRWNNPLLPALDRIRFLDDFTMDEDAYATSPSLHEKTTLLTPDFRYLNEHTAAIFGLIQRMVCEPLKIRPDH